MTDKKVISLLLAVIMLLSSFMPIAYAANNNEFTIEDSALLENLRGYDENGDGKFSQEEMDKMTIVTIPEGAKSIKGLEHANNIETLAYYYNGTLIDFSTLNKDNITWLTVYLNKEYETMDISFIKDFKNLDNLTITSNYPINIDILPLAQLTKLSSLSLSNVLVSDYEDIKTLTNLDYFSNTNNDYQNKNIVDISAISNLKNLEYIYINGMEIKNINAVSNLSKLTSVAFQNCSGISDLSALKNSKGLTRISASSSDIASIAFISELPNLTSIDLYGTKISDKEKANFLVLKDYNAYIGENFDIDIQASISGLLDAEKWNYVSENEGIVIANGSVATANSVGTTNIKITLKEDESISKTMKVTVSGISSNQATGTEAGKSTLISEELILNANGDLWRVYENAGKTQKIDTNVKKYVYEFIYTDNDEAFNYTLTQKNDGSVKYVFNGVERPIENVKDIYNNGYLSTDGVFYTINEDGTWEETTNNVEKIVGSYLVKSDGKTYTTTNSLVCNFKIIAASYNNVVDGNKTVWEVWPGQEPKKIGENFKEFVPEDNTLYYTTDGKIMDEYGNEKQYLTECPTALGNTFIIDKNNQLILNEKVVLTNVVSMILRYEPSNTGTKNSALLVRNDGSVWILKISGEAELTKLEPQSDNVYFENKNYTTKPTAGVTSYTAEVLVGFDIKNLSVNQAISASNFKSGFTAKAFKDGIELTGTEKISTGTIIELYNSKGELVEEYTALVYGDVTGSGNPGSKDALAIVKNRTGKVAIEDALNLEAARVTESSRQKGGIPTSSDALAIIKAKLGKYTINV